MKPLDTLRREPGLVIACAKTEHLATDQIPAEWFIASQIHLRKGTGRDLIVQPASNPDIEPSNRCLFGANVGPFWVFVEAPTGYELALDTSGHNLKVLNSYTKGYRDIEVISATAAMMSTAIYKFDGKVYKLFSTRSKNIQ